MSELKWGVAPSWYSPIPNCKFSPQRWDIFIFLNSFPNSKSHTRIMKKILKTAHEREKTSFFISPLTMIPGNMLVCVFSHYSSSLSLPLSLHPCLYLSSSPTFHSARLSPGLCLFVIKLKCFPAFHPSAGVISLTTSLCGLIPTLWSSWKPGPPPPWHCLWNPIHVPPTLIITRLFLL